MEGALSSVRLAVCQKNNTESIVFIAAMFRTCLRWSYFSMGSRGPPSNRFELGFPLILSLVEYEGIMAALHFLLNIRYSDPRFWLKGKNNLKKEYARLNSERTSPVCVL